MNLKHTLQSGRSMVEMLGVLAIIGVLSVGAIVGYSYGMAKYRANETINDIMLNRLMLMELIGLNIVAAGGEFLPQNQFPHLIIVNNIKVIRMIFICLCFF